MQNKSREQKVTPVHLFSVALTGRTDKLTLAHLHIMNLNA